jgi:hypothetical protein
MIVLSFSRSSSEIYKYRDLLHILLDFIAEASITSLHIPLRRNTRGLRKLYSGHSTAIWYSSMMMTWNSFMGLMKAV